MLCAFFNPGGVVVNGVLERLDCCIIFDGVRGLDGVRAVFDKTIDVSKTTLTFDSSSCSYCMSTCLTSTSSNTFVTTISQQFIVDWNASSCN